MFNKLVKARNSKKGFTLIEVMVVVAIIAILAAVAIPAYLSYRDDAKREVAKSSFSAVMESYNGLITIKGEKYALEIKSDTKVSAVIKHLKDNNAEVVADRLNPDALFLDYADTAAGGHYQLKKTLASGKDWKDAYLEDATANS